MSMINIVGATILAGIVLLMVLNLQFLMGDASNQAALNRFVQNTAEIFRQIIRNDIKDVGMAMTKPDESILIAEPNRFKYTVNNSFTATPNIQTISVFTRDWPVGNDPTPQNPNDFQMIRTIQLSTQTEAQATEDPYPVTGVAVTAISDTIFWYYDKDFRPTTVKKDIRYIRLKFKIESREPYQGAFAYAVVEEKVFLKNIWQF